MKRLLFAGAGVVAAATVALAADMRAAPVYKAPAAIAVHNWTGFYVGGFVGGAWGGDVNVLEGVSQGGVFPAGTCYNAPRCAPYSYGLGDSVITGLTAGYDWQSAGSPFVFGLEGEVGYIRLKKSRPDPNSVPTLGSDTRDSTKVGDWYGIIAGRLGYTWDRALLYVKGGVAFVDIETSVLDACTAAPCGGGLVNAAGDKTATSWAVGGGLEWAWTNNWSLKAEYLFIGIDESVRTCGPGAAAAAGSTFCWTHDIDGIHTAKIGLNYRWGGPVVAKY